MPSPAPSQPTAPQARPALGAWSRFTLGCVVFPILALLTEAAAIGPVMRELDRRWTEPQARSKFGGNFPVLVILKAASGPGHVAHLVYINDVALFTEQHPDYSFLVPEAEEASLRKQLRDGQRASGRRGESMNPPFDFDFKILKREPGRQELEVDGNDDDWRMRGSYVATDKSYVPGNILTYFGPGAGMIAVPLATLLNGAFWLAVLVVYRVATKKRRAALAGPPG